MNTASLLPPLATGLATYAGALGGAGGRTLEALQRGGLAAALYASPPYDLAVPAMSVTRVSICLTESLVEGQLDGDRPRRFEAGRHAVFVTPAGAAAHWRKARASRHLNLYLPADDLPTGPLQNRVLPGLRPWADALARELASHDPFAAEAADSLARLVLVHLRRQALATVLSTPELARLQAFVEAHLEQRLYVHDLAAVVGWSPARFAPAFARQTGLTPHQWVMQRRVARAQALLQGSRSGLADIAAACGFASQQHMTTLMRRRLGRTPAQLRAEC